MAKKGLLKGEYCMYQGKPLVRENNAYCYGDMNDKAVLFLIVLTTKEVNGEQIPDDILMQLISTSDPSHVIKQAQKKGLYETLDVGMVWLKKELGF